MNYTNQPVRTSIPKKKTKKLKLPVGGGGGTTVRGIEGAGGGVGWAVYERELIDDGDVMDTGAVVFGTGLISDAVAAARLIIEDAEKFETGISAELIVEAKVLVALELFKAVWKRNCFYNEELCTIVKLRQKNETFTKAICGSTIRITTKAWSRAYANWGFCSSIFFASPGLF